MELQKILLRPAQEIVIAQFVDEVGKPNNIVFSSAGNSTVSGFVEACEAQLPADRDNPAKSQIEQEISEIEYRLTQLKRSIGQT